MWHNFGAPLKTANARVSLAGAGPGDREDANVEQCCLPYHLDPIPTRPVRALH